MEDGDYYVLGGDILLSPTDPDHRQMIDSLFEIEGEVSRGVKKTGVKEWPITPEKSI